MNTTSFLHRLVLPRRLAALALLAPLSLGLCAAQARAEGETLTLTQNDPSAVVGRATNFTASGTLNPEDTMFGFDIYIFVKDADIDPTCAADFETESAAAMHSGGNESWVSPSGGFQVGTGPTYSQPFKITFTGAGNYLLCGYVQGDFSTFASAQLRGIVSGEAKPPEPPPAAVPNLVRAPWITRAGHRLTCHPGAWSPAPTSLGYSWYLKGGRKVGSGPSLTVRRALRGHSVLCRVTAADAAGAKTASTRPVRAG
ncbi:MAG TPA: hypothetical protein VF731_00605 [Solirubrobacterales bacterium]